MSNTRSDVHPLLQRPTDPDTPQHRHWRLEGLVTGSLVVGGKAIAFLFEGGSQPLLTLMVPSMVCRPGKTSAGRLCCCSRRSSLGILLRGMTHTGCTVQKSKVNRPNLDERLCGRQIHPLGKQGRASFPLDTPSLITLYVTGPKTRGLCW